MKRHPSKKLIQLLLLTEEDIKAYLSKYELPPIEKPYLLSVEEELDNCPKGFVIDKEHEESCKYLKSLGIYNLAFPDKFTLEAYSLLGTLHIRSDLEKLLLSREKTERIAKNLTTKFKTPVTKEGIERYCHYFWNVNDMKIEDWDLIFKDRRDRRENMNILRTGPDYARYVLGFVQKCQIKQSLEEIASIIHFDMQALKSRPEGPEKTKMLSSMAMTLMKIDGVVNTSATSIQEDMAMFERIRVTHLQADIKGADDPLYLGNYTGSGDLKELTRDSTTIDID